MNTLARGFASWWNTWPSSGDEATRCRAARKLINRYAYVVLPISILIVAGGAFLKPLAWWQVFAMCFCGILDTKLVLNGLKKFSQQNIRSPFGGLVAVVGMVLVDPTAGLMSHQERLLSMMSAGCCSIGTTAFLCWLFRESFLQFVAPVELTADCFANPQSRPVAATISAPL